MRTVLVDLLEQTLDDLRIEIHHTDRYAFRDELKEKESLLRRLIEKLQSLQS